MISDINPFEILGVNENSSDKEIKEKYFKLMLKYHPDKINKLPEDKKKEYTEKAKNISNSYNLIKNKEARDKYKQEMEQKKYYENMKNSSQAESPSSFKFSSFNVEELDEDLFANLFGGSNMFSEFFKREKLQEFKINLSDLILDNIKIDLFSSKCIYCNDKKLIPEKKCIKCNNTQIYNNTECIYCKYAKKIKCNYCKENKRIKINTADLLKDFKLYEDYKALIGGKISKILLINDLDKNVEKIDLFSSSIPYILLKKNIYIKNNIISPIVDFEFLNSKYSFDLPKNYNLNQPIKITKINMFNLYIRLDFFII